MKIVIDPFDRKSVENAMALLAQYKQDFRAKETIFVKRLAEIGVSVASAGFATADYDGENDVQVTMTPNGTSATITAYGETVGFIEFGTGVRFPEWDASGTGYVPPRHGTYGMKKGANPHGWYFKQNEGAKARHTYGNPPAEAMRTARDVMIEKVAQIAREVWR